MDEVMTDPNFPNSPFGDRSDPRSAQSPYASNPYSAPHEPAYQSPPPPAPRRNVAGGPVMSARREVRMRHSEMRRNILIGISVIVGLILALIATDTIKLGTGPRPKVSETGLSAPATRSTVSVAGNQLEAIRTPTAEDPLRVYIAGDSLTGSYGEALGTQLGETGVIKATWDSRPSSGLVNYDFFNWYRHSKSMMSSIDPEIVVFMIGTNDASIVSSNPKGYVKSYSEDLNDIIDIFDAEKRKVFFVLPPAMQNSRLNSNVTKLNYVITSVAQDRGARIIDSNESLSPAYKYVSSVKAGSKTVTVRAGDGIHISGAGGNILATQIYNTLEKLYGFNQFASETAIKPSKVKGCCSSYQSGSSTTVSKTTSKSTSSSSTSSSTTTSSSTPIGTVSPDPESESSTPEG
jgi:hypothetical protein